jgi:hypothetical protein
VSSGGYVIIHFKFKTCLVTGVTNPLYLPNIIFLALCFEVLFNLQLKIGRKNIVVHSFYKPFLSQLFAL